MALKKILLSDARPGMELANDITDNDGRLIIPYGTILDWVMIKKMDEYNIVVIKIVVREEDFLLKSQKKNIDKEEKPGYFEKLKSTSDFKEFENTFTQNVDELENQINNVVAKNNEFDLQLMLAGVKKIIEANKTGNSMLDVINCMRHYDDLTYVHSMNVSLICNMIAGWLNYSEEETDVLTAAGLLHDIGKVKIPKKIINKKGKLSDKEFQIIKYHPMLGYEIIKDLPIDERIKKAALMHHERYDGRGYPKGLKGNEIDEMAKIVAVADVYDAMTSNRVYREGLCPFDVISHFQNDLSIYDPKYLLLFLKKTAETYISNKVLLNNGKEAEVLMINREALGRPVVMSENKAIDLSKQHALKIVKLL